MSDDREWRALCRLRDQLHSFSVGDFREASEYLVRRVGELVQAEEGYVVLTRHVASRAQEHPLHGWEVVHYQTVCRDPEERDRIIRQWLAENELHCDPINAAVTEPGQPATRTYWYMQDGAFADTKARPNNLFERCGHCDQVWGATGVAEGAEVWLGLLRRTEEGPFSDADRIRLERALHILRPLLRRWALLFGLCSADRPLTPRQRTVLAGLLRGQSEGEIADELGLSPGSVHQVVAALYRNFGVRSRSELLTQWI